MLYEEITEKIIGAAYTVYNNLGSGFLESVYEKALVIELKKHGFNLESLFPIQVYYDNFVVGEYIADLFIEDKLIVELKAVKNLTSIHELQLVNYLTATKTNIGL